MAWKIHTETFGGNMHDAANAINKLDWGEWLLQMDVVGHYTICVFRMPAAMVHKIRAEKPSYVADPHHDDPTPPKRTRAKRVTS